MECEEDLMDVDKQPSPTSKSARSASPENLKCQTAEKLARPTRLTDLDGSSMLPMSCQRTREQTNNPLHGSQDNRRSHFSKIRKEYSSLKRNLNDVFNNISNADEGDLKKDTEDDHMEFKDKDLLKTPVKQEIRHSLLDCMSPIQNEEGNMSKSILNGMTPTPFKRGFMDQKPDNIPSFTLFKEQAAKISGMPHFIPFSLNTKENGQRQFNDTFDSQQIYEELCGKKRSKQQMVLPSGGVIPDVSQLNSLIYSPSKIRYEPCTPEQSSPETPHLHEKSEEPQASQFQPKLHSGRNLSRSYQQVAESEDEEEAESENNPGIKTTRSERGLKRLSVKVRDLVFKLKETSYKDVANRLIDELVNDDEYDEEGNKLDRRISSDRKTKEEKNVRRRVYDALNVLIASGVLKKNANKNVMYEERPESRMKGLKLVVKKRHENKKRHLAKRINSKRQLLQAKQEKMRIVSEKLNAITNL